MKENGTIFLFIGGEGELTYHWVTSGGIFKLAKTYKGLALALEHRYYGQSQPTADLSLENLKYLRVDQAIEDIRAFILDVKDQNSLVKNSKVIVVGGSYPGGLAEWIRQKYPAVVDGAWASSAVVDAEADYKGENLL